MLPYLRLTAVIALAAVLICGGGCKPSATAVTEVRLGYFANVTHAQAVLGVSSGEFAAALQPTKLSTRVFNAGPSLIEALFAGEIDVGYVGPGPTISAFARSHGEAIRVISGVAANGVLIVARKDSGINSLEDLKGKKLATPQPGNTQDIAARHYLLSVLKQSDANNIVPVTNADQAGLMSRGQIDAAWVPEPWGSRLITETGAKLIGEEKDLWPDKNFSLTVVVTTPEFAAKHPDLIAKILGVHSQWTKRLQQEPDKYADQLNEAIAGLTGKKLPAGVMSQSLAHVTFTDDPLPATFRTMAQWSYDLGFATQQDNLDKLFELKRAAATQPAS